MYVCVCVYALLVHVDIYLCAHMYMCTYLFLSSIYIYRYNYRHRYWFMYLSRYRSKYYPYHVPIIQVGKFEVYNFLKVYYIWVAKIRFQFCSLALFKACSHYSQSSYILAVYFWNVNFLSLLHLFLLRTCCRLLVIWLQMPCEGITFPLPQPSLYFAQPPALPSPFLTPKSLASVRCKIKLQTPEMVPSWGTMIDCHSLIIWKVWEWAQEERWSQNS